MNPLLRKPRRLTITVSDHVHQMLITCSDQQGRSLSNLAAYLLETALDPPLAITSDATGSAGLHARIDSTRTLQPLPVFGHQFTRSLQANSMTKTKQPVA